MYTQSCIWSNKFKFQVILMGRNSDEMLDKVVRINFYGLTFVKPFSACSTTSNEKLGGVWERG